MCIGMTMQGLFPLVKKARNDLRFPGTKALSFMSDYGGL